MREVVRIPEPHAPMAEIGGDDEDIFSIGKIGA